MPSSDWASRVSHRRAVPSKVRSRSPAWHCAHHACLRAHDEFPRARIRPPEWKAIFLREHPRARVRWFLVRASEAPFDVMSLNLTPALLSSFDRNYRLMRFAPLPLRRIESLAQSASGNARKDL